MDQSHDEGINYLDLLESDRPEDYQYEDFECLDLPDDEDTSSEEQPWDVFEDIDCYDELDELDEVAQ